MSVSFTPEQQETIDGLIKGAQSKAAKELRAERDALQTEVEALKAQRTGDDSAVVKQLRAQLEAERAKAGEVDNARKLSILLDAVEEAGLSFHRPVSAVRLAIAEGSLRVDERGQLEVIDTDGRVSRDNSYRPLTAAGYLRRFAQQHSYLLKGQAESNSAKPPAGGSSVSTTPKMEDVFGRRSSARIASEYFNRDPEGYRAMRQVAREKGLI